MRPQLSPEGASEDPRPQPLYPLFNLRSRVHELPATSTVLGNFAFCACIPATRQELHAWDLSEFVDRVQAVATVPEPMARRWARNLVQTPGLPDPTSDEYLRTVVQLENVDKMEADGSGDGTCVTNWTVLDWSQLNLGGRTPTDVGTLAGGDAGFSFARLLSRCPRSSGMSIYTRVPEPAAKEWVEAQRTGGVEGVVRWLWPPRPAGA